MQTICCEFSHLPSPVSIKNADDEAIDLLQLRAFISVLDRVICGVLEQHDPLIELVSHDRGLVPEKTIDGIVLSLSVPCEEHEWDKEHLVGNPLLLVLGVGAILRRRDPRELKGLHLIISGFDVLSL